MEERLRYILSITNEWLKFAESKNVALQTERFQIKAIEEALVEILVMEKGWTSMKPVQLFCRGGGATKIRTQNLMTKISDQNKRAGGFDALERRADRQTVLLRGIRHVKPEDKEKLVGELGGMRTRINDALSQIEHVEHFMQNGSGKNLPEKSELPITKTTDISEKEKTSISYNPDNPNQISAQK